MAASCWNLARSALLKGVRPLSGHLGGARRRPAGPVGAEVARCRPLHAAHGPALYGSKTGQPQTADTPKDDRNTGEEEEVDDGPEYIPRRKGKNPMVKIGYAWMIGLPSGILAFVLAKREVDKNRLKQLKIRQRMKISNEGDYEGSRYRNRGEQALDMDR